MHPTASIGVTVGIAVMALATALGFVRAIHHVRPTWTTRAEVATASWLVITAAIATSGILRDFERRPPPMALMFVVVIAGGVALGFSRVGTALTELPLWVLVIAQAFRLPLELVMHAAADEGTLPAVMTWTGLNYDVVTGAGALVVGLALRRGAPRKVAWIWSALSTATLVAVLFVAFLASPMVHRFGPTQVDTALTYAPFVWLPCILVVLAVAGQVVVLRALVGAPRLATE
jgi:hypothetical protein